MSDSDSGGVRIHALLDTARKLFVARRPDVAPRALQNKHTKPLNTPCGILCPAPARQHRYLPQGLTVL
eukprot:6377246-Pyramimonas_sp.AAC.1